MTIRVVLDANIYISALMKFSSPPGIVLQTLIEVSKYEIIVSENILEELKRALFYPKVRKWIKKSDEEILLWLNALVVHSFHIQKNFSTEKNYVLEDPDDDKYIIAAIESHASFIVTGDKHLLNLKKIERIQIVTAAEFLEEINFKKVSPKSSPSNLHTETTPKLP